MNSYYNRVKRLGPICLIYYCFSIILLTCSSNPAQRLDHNVEITIRTSPEPLLDYVNSARFLVAASAMEPVFDTSYAIEPESYELSTFELDLESGNNRIFAVQFRDQLDRTLFKSMVWDDIREDRLLNIDLTLRQSGFGSGSVLKIIRDEPPWESYGLDTSLVEIGLTVGTNTNQFYIYSSGDLPAIELTPGTDALIISNDQPQAFYDNLSSNLDFIIEFAQNGGTILWGTCDLAWNYGSYASAGLDSFPGGIRHSTSYDAVNLIQNSDLLLTSGLSDTLTGIYASNKYFIDVPDSAIIYLRNSSGEPTLIGYPLGLGWIILSGQPLEYNYDRRENYNMGFLLPRVISFILGLAWDGIPLNYPGRDRLQAANSSSGPTSESRLEGAPCQ